MDKYDQFRRKYDPSYAAKMSGGGMRINWGSNPTAQNVFGGANAMKNEDDDDDLYN